MQQLAHPPPPALSSFGIFLDLGARFSAFISRDAILLQNSNEKIGKLYKIQKYGMLAYFARKLPQIVKRFIRKKHFPGAK